MNSVLASALHAAGLLQLSGARQRVAMGVVSDPMRDSLSQLPTNYEGDTMKTMSLLGLLLLACVGCHERVMVAPDPHAVILAVKAQCDADDAVRAADNPARAYLWRLESWHEEDDSIRFYISKYDDIFTRTRMELHVLPSPELGKVVVDYSFHVPTSSSPVGDLAVLPLVLDRPTPEQILDRVQDLVTAQAAKPVARTPPSAPPGPTPR